MTFLIILFLFYEASRWAIPYNNSLLRGNWQRLKKYEKESYMGSLLSLISLESSKSERLHARIVYGGLSEKWGSYILSEVLECHWVNCPLGLTSLNGALSQRFVLLPNYSSDIRKAFLFVNISNEKETNGGFGILINVHRCCWWTRLATIPFTWPVRAPFSLSQWFINSKAQKKWTINIRNQTHDPPVQHIMDREATRLQRLASDIHCPTNFVLGVVYGVVNSCTYRYTLIDIDNTSRCNEFFVIKMCCLLSSVVRIASSAVSEFGSLHYLKFYFALYVVINELLEIRTNESVHTWRLP